MNTAVIGIGSNIDPQSNIEKAKQLLEKYFQVKGESRFVQTKPVGHSAQADFTNGAVLVQTDMDHARFRKTLKELEHRLGRQPAAEKFGPRTIDLDILTWNGEVTDEDFYTRDFIKQSVLELIPNLRY